jgi:hypothetical protein
MNRANMPGRTPKNQTVVDDAYRWGQLQDVGINGAHIIGELLDVIDDLKNPKTDEGRTPR